VPIERLLVVGSGSVAAMFLPFWLNWMRYSYPRIQCQVVLTRSAQRFVTAEAVGMLTGRAAIADVWEAGTRPRSVHVELQRWAEAVVVYPATFHYLSRLALGLTDTPSLLALQCTDVPVGVAAAVPPGGWSGPVMRRHREALAARDNVVVVPPVPGRSMSDDSAGHQVDNLPAVISAVASVFAARAAASAVPAQRLDLVGGRDGAATGQ
jgi:phosphopantothenoylcysteine decarboxylase/phosphopantothenate--cysteine ligase